MGVNVWMDELRLYELALDFAEIKPWEILTEQEVFAVRFADGETGYCSVTGRMGTMAALNIYVGEWGYASYVAMTRYRPDMYQMEYHEIVTSLDCIQCAFPKSKDAEDAERKAARAAAKKLGRSIPRNGRFPCFQRFREGREPVDRLDETDMERMGEALALGLEICGLLKEKGPEELGLVEVTENTREVVAYTREGEAWERSSAKFPSGRRPYAVTPFENDMSAMRIRRMKKIGVWECGTFYLMMSVAEEGESAGHLPLAMMIVDEDEGLLGDPVISDGADAAMLEQLADLIRSRAAAPYKIKCGDERCYALLKNFCERTNIRLVQNEPTDELYDTEEDFLDFVLGGGADDEAFEASMLWEELMDADDDVLRAMPQPLKDMLAEMDAAGQLPETLAERLRRLR